ncbi:glycosyltransferase [Spirosoma sp. HMF4905]|uniref:Glycosyltransferase n=1 Tax=Spirosoma arboris TaxID=2682092 RepID=A0A7K1S614_9BACT|nr:glycosyltransferase family 1 protein [Spirosoma arboris]MVM29261.1 glycosyltransferase [Spirosoma arboris]
MIVTYLFRSRGTGNSIEELFGSIQRELDRQPDMLTTRIQLPYVSRGWWSVWQNMRFLRAVSATIFHITGDIHYAALALPASHTVLTIHDCSILEKSRNHPLRYALFWLFWYYLPIRRAGVVTVVSEKTQQDLVRHVGQVAQKAVVVANGYDPAFVYQPAAFRKQSPILLQVGTAPNKNLLRLIAAIEGIVCTLIIIGPLTNIITRALREYRINYRNYIDLSRARVVQLYEECDIVTFVSTYEGFGMPILEANAVGRAVISSDLEPMCTIGSDAAHFVNPTDVSAIRQGILQLIQDDTLRQSLIEAGRKNVQRYTVTATANQYRSLYEKLAGVQSLSKRAV